MALPIPLRGRAPDDRRAGFGTIFFVCISILSILIIVVGVRHFGSLGSASRETSHAVEIGRRANLLAESAVEEVVQQALLADLKDGRLPGPDRLFRRIRQYTAGSPVEPSIKPVQGGRPFLAMAKLAAEETYRLFNEQADLELVNEDAAVFYGIQEQQGFPGNHPEANESIGTLAFVHAATAKGSGVFRNIDRAVEFEKEYRVVLTAPSWPFTPYSLFVRNDPDQGTPHRHDPGRIFDILAELKAKHDEFKRIFDLNQAVLDEAERNFVPFPTDDLRKPFLIRAGEFQGSPLADFFRNMPLLSGIATNQDLSRLRDTVRVLYEQFAARHLFTPVEAARFDPGANPYGVMDVTSWSNKTTHRVKDVAGLVAATLHPKKTGVMLLYGVYHVEDKLTLDFNWEGHGIIVCEGKNTAATDPAVTVVRMKSDNPGSGSLVIVSRTHIDIGAAADNNLDADLLAPSGTVIGLELGKKVNGAVVVNYLLKGPILGLPELVIDTDPARGAYLPWKPGGDEPPADQIKRLQVFFGDGFITKQYWARREYQR